MHAGNSPASETSKTHMSDLPTGKTTHEEAQHKASGLVYALKKAPSTDPAKTAMDGKMFFTSKKLNVRTNNRVSMDKIDKMIGASGTVAEALMDKFLCNQFMDSYKTQEEDCSGFKTVITLAFLGGRIYKMWKILLLHQSNLTEADK